MIRVITINEQKDIATLAKEFNRDEWELKNLLIDNGLNTEELYHALQLNEL
mgnify:CR=1 FL=1